MPGDQPIQVDIDTTFEYVQWKRIEEFPAYDVSNTGRIRFRALGGTFMEMERDSLGMMSLFHGGRGFYSQVNGWDMANRYFYPNHVTKRIVADSVLASS